MEAAEFSTSTAYAVGDLVIYGGVLYVFTSAHSAGAWNDADVSEVDENVEQELTRIITGAQNATKAADFVDTLAFSPSQITETRYKYMFTNAPDPRD